MYFKIQSLQFKVTVLKNLNFLRHKMIQERERENELERKKRERDR